MRSAQHAPVAGGVIPTPARGTIDVDAALGVLPRGPAVDGSVSTLLEHMDRLGIETAYVSHTHAWHHDPYQGNTVLHSLCQSSRFIPVPTMHPDDLVGRGQDSEDGHLEAQLFRLCPRSHGYALTEVRAEGLMRRVEAVGAAVIVALDETSWSDLADLSRRFPALTIIVGHLGYRELRRARHFLHAYPRGYITTSNLSSNQGLELMAREFPDRVLFGTGYPLRDPHESVGLLGWSSLAPETQSAVARENVRRILGLMGAEDGQCGPDHLSTPRTQPSLAEEGTAPGRGWG